MNCCSDLRTADAGVDFAGRTASATSSIVGTLLILFVHRWLSVGAEHQAQAIDGKHGVSDQTTVTRDCNALMASAAQMEFGEMELAEMELVEALGLGRIEALRRSRCRQAGDSSSETGD
jgi:hypothetical protein